MCQGTINLVLKTVVGETFDSGVYSAELSLVKSRARWHGSPSRGVAPPTYPTGRGHKRATRPCWILAITVAGGRAPIVWVVAVSPSDCLRESVAF